MKTVKLGLIGAGGIAQVHAQAISEIGGAEIVAVCDVLKEKAAETAKQWKIGKVFDSYEELVKMKELDGVLVCTPGALHAAPTVAALQAGKHVFCEKPMEAGVKAAASMAAAAHKAKKILMVGLKLRYTPQVMEAKKLMQSGALGDIYYAEAVTARRRGNPGGNFIKKSTSGFGVIADIGVYPLDTALYVMGHPKPVSVCSIMSNELSKTVKPVENTWTHADISKTEVEDFAACWVRFDNGARMVFKSAWCMHMDNLGGTFFLGTKGGLRIGVGEVQGTGEELKLFRDEYGMMTDTNIPTGSIDFREMFRREDSAFRDAILSNGPSPIDPDKMLYTNVIFQGAIDSAAQGGKEVFVKIPKVR